MQSVTCNTALRDGDVTSLYLLDGLEAEGVRLELVGEALGPGAELLRDVPHAGGELCQDTCGESESG